MNRKELLNRLKQMEDNGEDMSLPVAVRVTRRVIDGRRRNGHRTEESFATLSYACSGSLVDGTVVAELTADYLREDTA